jgi:hypothetical protein
MMKTLLKFALLPFLAIGLVSCEEVIELELDKGESQLAVDALVSVEDGPQTIRLTLTTAYFDNAAASGASDAIVKIIRKSDGKEFLFRENPSKPGNYVSDSSLYGNPLEAFELNISFKGNTYSAISNLPRKQLIDSLNQAYRESEFGLEAGIYLDLFSQDPARTPEYPLPDYFWLRYNFNGQVNRQPGSLLVGADAAFQPGVADGLPLIYPVRNSINGSKPFVQNDTIGVELLSIDAEIFRYLKEAQTQITNTGLFAQPSANVKGNIVNSDPASKVPALGSFGMCQISRAGVRVK